MDGMFDKTLASKFWGQGSNPATRPTCEAGGLTYPVIQVYGRPISSCGALRECAHFGEKAGAL